ncbi:MAG: DUF6164 family protein [Methylicorpusculum sp.]|uniref:DUF6164 family protein n=1 Tax=Methylicorpusculum sp. TaxID=2713644 RepID=UPI002723E03D|nr:DUF6164 family protein [Methylicorpusculum sp.]MDO8843466.1 DUF6164 family protein [Methylicorpusculum sp.]MDO9239147.1 DUF6164 family protein [Methylicorpusculum sp.]MDP2180710.1 DUF6164 family protein [Methylicorpusculum sp.]
MSKLLFSLRNVPDDEAEDIRTILQENNIDYYETPPGNWGISMPAIWVRDDLQFDKATHLLNDYQDKRAITQRQLYQQLIKEGKMPGFFGYLHQNFYRFIIHVLAVGLVIYVSMKLILEFGL